MPKLAKFSQSWRLRVGLCHTFQVLHELNVEEAAEPSKNKLELSENSTKVGREKLLKIQGLGKAFYRLGGGSGATKIGAICGDVVPCVATCAIQAQLLLPGSSSSFHARENLIRV